jgi:hypothetical protein
VWIQMPTGPVQKPPLQAAKVQVPKRHESQLAKSPTVAFCLTMSTKLVTKAWFPWHWRGPSASAGPGPNSESELVSVALRRPLPSGHRDQARRPRRSAQEPDSEARGPGAPPRSTVQQRRVTWIMQPGSYGKSFLGLSLLVTIESRLWSRARRGR